MNNWGGYSVFVIAKQTTGRMASQNVTYRGAHSLLHADQVQIIIHSQVMECISQRVTAPLKFEDKRTQQTVRKLWAGITRLMFMEL